MHIPRFGAPFALIVLVLFSSTTAAAERPVWRPEWPKFRPAEIAFTAGNTMQVVASVVLWNQPTRNFDGPILFDEPIRDGLRLRTRDARTAAATASDMMYYALLFVPAVEAPIVGGIRGDREVAVQTLAINFQSYAFAGATAIALEKVGRARPSARECDRDPSYDRRCDDKPRLNTSNVSGHTAIAFTGAGLTCAHHLNLPLYGGGAPDIAVCVAALSVATAQAVLRINSDNHYATDVILGASLGLASGYALPKLLHYRTASGKSASLLPTFRSRELGAHFVVAPTFGGVNGASITGAF
ncbi:MAG TPA: phosphatase PAP2 family protein [Labilithrix sp.]|nr:phosphatase PAP2 family protein [Labilithrix sp.]